MKLLDYLWHHLGKILLIASMLVSFFIVHIVAPPVHYRVLYNLVYLLSVTPILFILWRFRRHLFDLKLKRKIGIFFFLLVLMTISNFSYYYFYKSQIIRIDHLYEDEHCIYFPYFIDDDLQGKIEKEGGKEKAILKYGPDQIRIILANNSTNIVFTNYIFGALALISNTLLFMILMLLYIGFLKPATASRSEEGLIPQFMSMIPLVSKIKEKNKDLQEEVHELLQNNDIKESIELIIEKGDKEQKASAIAISAKHSDLEREKLNNLISSEEYELQISRIIDRLLKLVG